MFAHVSLRNNKETKTAGAVYNDYVELMRTHHPLHQINLLIKHRNTMSMVTLLEFNGKKFVVRKK